MYEMSSVVKSLETGSRLVVVGGQGQGRGGGTEEYCLMGTEFTLGEMKPFWN